MDILLSLHPNNIDKIVNGIKGYEFRRTIYKSFSIKKVYVYATSPIKKIVATFNIENVLCGTPEKIWDKCGNMSGMNKEDLKKYFYGKEKVYAIKIINFKMLKEPIDPREYIENFYPPQFFIYIEGKKLFNI